MNNSISVASLQNGEKVAMCILEVKTVPHISIIDATSSLESIARKYRAETMRLLNGLYQQYKSFCETTGHLFDLSYEIMWLTEPTVNQPFKAAIKLVCIIRAIDKDIYRAKKAVDISANQISASLNLQKYDIETIDYSDLSTAIQNVGADTVKAIIKDEKVDLFQNQSLPVCYSYNRFPQSQNDFAGIVDALTSYPNSVVSFQLIPTAFSNDELNIVEYYSYALENTKNAIFSSNTVLSKSGFYCAFENEYRYYSERKNGPLFLFNILIYGNNEAATSISNRIYSDLSSDTQSVTNLKIIDLQKNELRKDTNFYPLPWAVNEIILNRGRNTQIWKSRIIPPACYRLPYIVTAEEAASLVSLPVGSNDISAGLKINESQRRNKTYHEKTVNAGDISIGYLKSSNSENTIGITMGDLTKHMFVTGTPGSGKTTFSVGLLDRLWKNHGIPFLVIEPAKNEYRALIDRIPDIQVFTPGKNYISPFVFNPFTPPKNVRLESYKTSLKTAFSAAVSMTTPLDKIFEEAINNCYSQFGWFDSFTTDDPGKVFNIADFIKCFNETFEKIGYTGDAKNIGRAGVVRLSSLAYLFDNYFTIPIEDLMNKPTIIELAAIENSDQKSLIISLLLLSILAYVNANYVGDGKLRNVILLEEAHVLLDAKGNNIQGEANPSEVAQNLVKRMLAEIRSYGVGMIIADQSPRKVTSDVIALTDIKTAFRIVEGEDKRIIADSTGMTEAQTQRLSKLKSGEAFLFFNKLEEPEEIIVPNYRQDNNIRITIPDSEIHTRSQYWNNRRSMLRPYPQCNLCKYCEKECDPKRRMLGREIARRILNNYFKPEMSDFEAVRTVFAQISSLVSAELNGQLLTHELLLCVKVHLWRAIRYNTKIPVRDIQIENSLKK